MYQLSFPDWLCNEQGRGNVLPDQSLAQQPFTFYATFDSDSECSYIPTGTSVLLPASSYARDNLRKPRLPGTIRDVAADCGGYVASRIWGEYRYSLEQYVNWLRSFSPRWAATMATSNGAAVPGNGMPPTLWISTGSAGVNPATCPSH